MNKVIISEQEHKWKRINEMLAKLNIEKVELVQAPMSDSLQPVEDSVLRTLFFVVRDLGAHQKRHESNKHLDFEQMERELDSHKEQAVKYEQHILQLQRQIEGLKHGEKKDLVSL